MKTILYSIAILLATLCWSCYDDKGNYDYTPFDNIVIEGISEQYLVQSFLDTLAIDVKVTPENADYEYLWTINTAYQEMPSMGDGFLPDTISTERTLNRVINYENGTYDLNLKVTDKNTGYAVHYNTTLVTQSAYSSGFYILKETADGNTEIDLHTSEATLADLLTENYGAPQAGTPTSMGLIFVYCHIDPENGEYTAPRALSVASGNEINVYNLNDLSVIFSHDDMFYGEVPSNDTPLYLFPNIYNIGYLSNNGIFTNYQNGMNIPSAGKFGLPLVMQNGCRPSKHAAYLYKNTYIFDELNHRFLILDFNGGIHFFSETPGEGVEQVVGSPNNIPENYELIYFGSNTFAENKCYAVFEDRDNPRQRYLYTLTLPDLYYYNNPITAIDKIPADKQFNRATVFGNHESQANVLYYAVGDQAYYYGVGSKTEQALTLQGFEGGEITYIGNRYWTQEGVSDAFDYFVVATHQNGRYKVYMYNTVGGVPNGAPVRTLEGEGKVVKIHYNSSFMCNGTAGGNEADADYYPCSF